MKTNLLFNNLNTNSLLKINYYNLVIKSSLKNSLFFLYDKNNYLIKQWSVRSQNYKKLEKKHNTQYNINKMVLDLINFLLKKKINFLNLIFIGIGIGRDEFERSFENNKFIIVNIFDNTKIPFNGCRNKKKKRI